MPLGLVSDADFNYNSFWTVRLFWPVRLFILQFFQSICLFQPIRLFETLEYDTILAGNLNSCRHLQRRRWQNECGIFGEWSWCGWWDTILVGKFKFSIPGQGVIIMLFPAFAIYFDQNKSLWKNGIKLWSDYIWNGSHHQKGTFLHQFSSKMKYI